MQSSIRFRTRWIYCLGLAALIVAAWGVSEWRQERFEQQFEGKVKVRFSGAVAPSVVASSPGKRAFMPAAAGSTGFTPQGRLGFTVGDQWEPDIMSSDSGKSWTAPSVIYPGGSTNEQVDAQIVVDPEDGKTVYAAWPQNNKWDILVGTSTDQGPHGRSWLRTIRMPERTSRSWRCAGRMCTSPTIIRRPPTSPHPTMAAPASLKSR